MHLRHFLDHRERNHFLLLLLSLLALKGSGDGRTDSKAITHLDLVGDEGTVAFATSSHEGRPRWSLVYLSAVRLCSIAILKRNNARNGVDLVVEVVILDKLVKSCRLLLSIRFGIFTQRLHLPMQVLDDVRCVYLAVLRSLCFLSCLDVMLYELLDLLLCAL